MINLQPRSAMEFFTVLPYYLPRTIKTILFTKDGGHLIISQGR